jgi:uncharacterized membrane protein YeaQ/YmgE (transglycosylase-associated protein family)
MHLSNESLIVIVIVGIVAGWLAGNIVRGGGYGLIGDLIVGIIGAFIGDWLLPLLSIHLGTGMVALVVNATLGAIVLLIILRLISGLAAENGAGVSGGVGNSSKARTGKGRTHPLGPGGDRPLQPNSQGASAIADTFDLGRVQRADLRSLSAIRGWTGRNLQAIALYWKSFITLTRVL